MWTSCIIQTLNRCVANRGWQIMLITPNSKCYLHLWVVCEGQNLTKCFISLTLLLLYSNRFFLNLLLPSQMTWTLSIQLISECYSQIQIIVHCCRSHNRRSRLVYSAWPCSISNGLASRDAKWTWIPWDRVLLNVNWVKKFSTSVLKIRLGRYLLKVITEFFIFCE
jgi:hypothetical protein